jgi:anti-sigma B factor antagonist
VSPEENSVPLDLCSVHRAIRYTTITLPAEIDIANASQVCEELLRALRSGPAVLVVDMTGTSFCGAAGVGALMRARGRAFAAGIGLRVAVSAPIVRQVLEMTGVDDLLGVYPGLGAALASLPVPDGSGDAEAGRDRVPLD